MRRLTARTVIALSLAALVGSAAAPAAARSPHAGPRGGKKPIGEVVSFDAATSALVLEVADGEEMIATVDRDAQVKLEHRGRHRGNKGHGSPSNGSLDDLVAGAVVVRMKLEDEKVTKIRLRPAPEAAAAPAEGDQSQDGAGDGSHDVEADDPSDDSTGDDSTGDDSTSDDSTGDEDDEPADLTTGDGDA
ncbi:MAG: hypothetical protein ABR613_05160 [Actinomycetota bacterium]